MAGTSGYAGGHAVSAEPIAGPAMPCNEDIKISLCPCWSWAVSANRPGAHALVPGQWVGGGGHSLECPMRENLQFDLDTPPPIRSLRELANAENECRRCPLYKNATQAVPGEGRRHARLM